ncbi:hypothetical protein M2145_002561 [Lachnospiraceae bacterium PF1-21]
MAKLKLNWEKIKKRPVKTISASEALKDVTPMKWSDDVLSGKKKVVFGEYKK